MDKEQLLYYYFSNELTPEQERQVAELLKTDADFKAQFDFEKDLQKVIRDSKSNHLKNKLVDFEKDMMGDTAVRNMRPNYSKWAMAASFTLLMTLGWLGYTNFSGPSYDKLYNSNFQEYPNTVYTITRGESVESIQREAFTAYETGNYEKAIGDLTKIPREDTEPYVDFYLAQCYLKLNQIDKARLSLQKTISSKSEFVAEAHWYLALIAIKEKDKEQAVEQLNLLISDFDYNKEKALELLKELE